jgi:hypothetical protein
MEIHHSLGVSRLVALMAEHRRNRAHHRLLSRLDLLVDEARALCAQAEDVPPNDARGSDPAIAFAFQTVLGQQTRDWMRRAERTVKTVRPSGDTLCGARAHELRKLIDSANVAMMRPAESRECWSEFYRSTREIQFTMSPSEH